MPKQAAASTLEISTPSDLEIAMTRVFDAPRHLVFEAWTKPEHLRRWFGGLEGWSMPVCEVDLRPGGAWRYVMHGPDGARMAMHGVYREIVAPERIVSTEVFEGEFHDEMGAGTINTLTFEERDGRTVMIATALYRSKEARDAVLASGMSDGAGQSFDRLAEVVRDLRTPAATPPNPTRISLRGEREVLIERVFDAPRDLVFRAWTEPDWLMKWWGPTEWPLARCTVDLRPGGAWHYCMRSRADGQEAWGKAVYELVEPIDRLVFRDTFSDAEGNEYPPFARTSVSFSDEGGRTRVTSLGTYDSAAERQKVLDMGMAEGITICLEQLAQHLAAAR